jgi:DNA-binding transcriptional LysR family regulator
MKRDELNNLAAFVVIADTGSFTRAAATLGMSKSALSHAIRHLEERLGIRLLARTTRSVSPTEAGQRLLRTLRPALADIAAVIAGLSELRDKASRDAAADAEEPQTDRDDRDDRGIRGCA